MSPAQVTVLIIAANRNRQPVAVMPYGACIVAEAAERAGHRVRLLDLMFERKPLKAVEQAVAATGPGVVGVSLRNIDNNDLRNPRAFADDLPPLFRRIRETTRAFVVIGGPAVGIMPAELLRASGADCAVVGEGEETFPALLRAIAAKETFRNIPGIAWLEDGVFHRNARFPFTADFPVPDFHRWIRADTYQSYLASAPLQTKRGCPYRCVYCTYATGEGKDYRLRAPDDVAAAARRLSDRGFRTIEIVDNVFNAPYDHAMDVCRALSRAGASARFLTVELNPRFVDDPLLSAMTDAGFAGIGITAESAAEPVLRGLGKEYGAGDVRAAAAAVARHRLPCLWMFMLGGPGETEETAAATFRFAEESVRPDDVAFFNVGIRIYPGTELEAVARREGVLAAAADDMLAPVSYVSPRLDLARLLAMLTEKLGRHHHFIDSSSLALPLLAPMYRLGSWLGLKPPLWKHVPAARRALRALGAEV